MFFLSVASISLLAVSIGCVVAATFYLQKSLSTTSKSNQESIGNIQRQNRDTCEKLDTHFRRLESSINNVDSKFERLLNSSTNLSGVSYQGSGHNESIQLKLQNQIEELSKNLILAQNELVQARSDNSISKADADLIRKNLDQKLNEIKEYERKQIDYRNEESRLTKELNSAWEKSLRNGTIPDISNSSEALNRLLIELGSGEITNSSSPEAKLLQEIAMIQASFISTCFTNSLGGDTRSAQRLLDPIPLNAYEFSKELWNDSLLAKNKLELAKHIALNLLTSHGYQLIQPVPGIDTISMQFHDERSQIETFDPKLVGKIASVRAPGLTFNGEIIRKAFVVQYVQGSGTPNAPIQVPIIPENAPQTVSQQISTMNEGGQLSTPEVQTAPFEQNPIDNLILSRTAVDSTPDVPELPQESVQPNSLQDVQAPSNITEITNQSDYQGESNATVMPNELKVEESHPTYSSPLFSDIEAPNSEEDFN